MGKARTTESRPPEVVALSAMDDGQEADLFALMTSKEELTTRDGKPYFRVGFRDAQREVAFPIWSDSTWAGACRDQWQPGTCYKLRAVYRETSYGPQLEIRQIREAMSSDAADGFDPAMFQPSSRFEPQQMFDELLGIAQEQIARTELRELAVDLLMQHREAMFSLPAATRNHHAFAGGFLEHVLNVARNCVWLADTYARLYPQMRPPLDTSLVVAGGILHDIGKLRELKQQPTGPEYTPEGSLIGHILQGRDMLREAAAAHALDDETLLRLEHIIVSHQRLPEWGSPKPPMTPEALLVHYADDVDAKFQMMYAALQGTTDDSPLTSSRNALRQAIYRGQSPDG